MLSIKEISKQTGFSTATVSRALDPRYSGKVKASTRQRIMALCDEYQFRPKFSAQALASGKTYTVGLISEDLESMINSPTFSQFVSFLAQELKNNNYTLSVLPVSDHDPETIDKEILHTFYSCRMDGFVLSSNTVGTLTLKELASGKFPVVTYQMPSDICNPMPVTSVRIDNRNAYRELLPMAVKNHFGGMNWTEWPEAIHSRTEEGLREYKEKLADEIDFQLFMQFQFFNQWYKLRAYANKKGIKIIGDIPIYVSLDSADAWSHPELFQLDEQCTPKAVAGCPPDGFSADGQMWGNPLYDWDYHKKTAYAWWIERLSFCFELYDVVRIDHFRGFDEYYSIPYGDKTAVNGSWKKGPGMDLFHTIEKKIGRKSVIAEDLGYITDTVRKLVADSGFMGTKVLEFAFDTRDTGSAREYLPHNYIENCVAYTGTHDNETLVGWWQEVDDEGRKKARDYLCDYYTPADKMYIPLIGVIMRSNAKICIVPIQDYLGLDNKSRMNTPSSVGSNWRWRVDSKELNKTLAKEIKAITVRYERCN